MSQTHEYTIAPVQKEDFDEILELLKRTFFIDEPLNSAVGLCSDSTSVPELEEYCTHSLLEGYSVKAVDKNGHIVGVMINGVVPLKEENGNDLLTQAEKCKNPKFQKILYILARREEGARLWEKYPEETRLLEIMVAATDPKWRRKGIMNHLGMETEKIAKQKGISLIRLDTSSAYSAASASRLGYTCVYKAKYADIKMDGRPLIVPEPPHVDDRVYVKKVID